LMAQEFRLVGFDRRTDEVAAEYPVPAEHVHAVLKLANPASIPRARLGDLPVSSDAAKRIGVILERRINTQDRDFFLESVSG
jgi:hypothetical protein